MRALVSLILCIGWIMGIVWSTGWWAFLAFVIPFYSYYVVIKHLMIMWGLL